MNQAADDSTIDERLAICCQLGDPQAWDQLVVRWNPKLLGFLNRMVGDPAVAEDLAQAIWLQIVRSISRLKDPGKLAGWIYRIARIAVTDRLREQYRRPPAAADSADPHVNDAAIERLIESEHLATALRQLHPQEREALVLHYFEHLSLIDAAAVCGVPVGTLKSRMNRARGSLRTILTSGDRS